MDPTTAALEKEHEAVSLTLGDCSAVLDTPENAPLFSFVLLDHQSQVCGQNPDREL